MHNVFNGGVDGAMLIPFGLVLFLVQESGRFRPLIDRWQFVEGEASGWKDIYLTSEKRSNKEGKGDYEGYFR